MEKRKHDIEHGISRYANGRDAWGQEYANSVNDKADGYNEALDEATAEKETFIKEIVKIVIEDVPHQYQERLIKLLSEQPKIENGLNPTKQHSMMCPTLCGGGECKCDGYHTFDELYDHRIALFFALGSLMGMIAEEFGTEGHEVWKSKLHSDGTMFDGWFIAGIKKEKGEQITYHIPISKWEDCCGEILEKAPEYDGHTSADVLNRLKDL